ncbi:aminoglycoside phosphotransferase family protein [Actinoallomurus sp. NPDC050550]|uniref:phosphotransferase family protein n=1 Tax=Actinoallomurus sp. NPDC050550 TaxID=3154937 RepID=UPI0033E61F06
MKQAPGKAAAADSIIDYLRSHGQLPEPRVTALTGGVSGDTVLVDAAPLRIVVKRALNRLLVAGEWTAKPERAMTEARAIELLHSITPECTPELRHADPLANTLVMTAAPADWVPWKSVLLGEAPDPALGGSTSTTNTSGTAKTAGGTSGTLNTASTLGAVLGTWHSRTRHDRRIAARFNDYEAFEQLRIAPFHRSVAVAHPAVAGRVDECVRELLARRDCLVHGDFSPKNVLIGPGGLMVLDFEVAHVGAAVFDLAFMQCHLVLKALHLPRRAAEMADAAQRFLRSYERACPEPVRRLGLHTACLLLARVDGLSPAEYLLPPARQTVRHLALSLLAADDPSATEMWDRVLRAAR